MIATMPALARSPRKTNRTTITSDHAFDQVVQHVVRRDVDQVGALIEDPELHPLGQEVLALDLLHLLGDRLGGRQRLLVLAHQDDALDDVVFGAAADDPQPGLVADDDLGDLADEDRRAVVRGVDDDLADVVELLGLDLGGLVDLGRVERVDPFAQKADGADVVRLASPG